MAVAGKWKQADAYKTILFVYFSFCKLLSHDNPQPNTTNKTLCAPVHQLCSPVVGAVVV